MIIYILQFIHKYTCFLKEKSEKLAICYEKLSIRPHSCGQIGNFS